MQVNAKTTCEFYAPDQAVDGRFRAGVSLHSHTQFSEESLDLIPKYVGTVPGLHRRIPFERAYWTPPLTPRQAHRLEEKQIARRFGLPALVSLTDHDNVQAGIVLHLLERYRHAPVSTEWTIPYGPTFFHLGVHNLPLAQAEGIMRQLASYTSNPNDDHLTNLLGGLHAQRGVLVVVNHPVWDEKGIGARQHRAVLLNLLAQHGEHLHALEVNGLRSWKENQEVLALGEELGMPVVAGGDRHGREPNALLNLTEATRFADFVEEVRVEKRSHIVCMPQYRVSRALRTTRMVIDALREYPERVHARRTWAERVFYRPAIGEEPLPLVSLWKTGELPAFLRLLNVVVRVASSGVVRPLARVALSETGVV